MRMHAMTTVRPAERSDSFSGTGAQKTEQWVRPLLRDGYEVQ